MCAPKMATTFWLLIAARKSLSLAQASSSLVWRLITMRLPALVAAARSFLSQAVEEVTDISDLVYPG